MTTLATQMVKQANRSMASALDSQKMMHHLSATARLNCNDEISSHYWTAWEMRDGSLVIMEGANWRKIGRGEFDRLYDEMEEES